MPNEYLVVAFACCNLLARQKCPDEVVINFLNAATVLFVSLVDVCSLFLCLQPQDIDKPDSDVESHVP